MPSGVWRASGPPIPGAPWTGRPRAARHRGGMVVSPEAIPAPQTFAGQLIPRVPPALMGTMGRAAHSINMLVDMVNDMVRRGRLALKSDGTWDVDITSADVTDALGYVPSQDTAHNISTITQSGFTALVATVGSHGLLGGEFITIAGSSNSGYDGDWMIDYVAADQFKLLTTTGGVITYIGNATGGTWRIT